MLDKVQAGLVRRVEVESDDLVIEVLMGWTRYPRELSGTSLVMVGVTREGSDAS